MSARGIGRRGLAFRIGLVTTAVAVLSVLIAAVVSYGLVRSAAENQARRQLGREAELVSGLVSDQPVAPRVRTLLQESGVTLVSIAGDGTQRGGPKLPERDTRVLLRGRTLSKLEALRGDRFYIEGRPTANGAIALVQSARITPRNQTEFLHRLAPALGIGLVAGAGAGLLLARRLARPLRRTAAGAGELAAGERGVHVPTEGPTEVAEVAGSINTLAAALSTSEARQRDFLLSVSHELRTPLTAISGFAEALADGIAEDPVATGRVVVDESARLGRLIDDLLALARLQAQDFSVDVVEVDLRAELREAARVWEARCRSAGIDFRMEEPDEPVAARTDPARVRQIVDGLAENALRVVPAGSPIVLALRDESEELVVEVRDGGPGLSADDLAVAFERGVLRERYAALRRGGSGIGLALVHGLATKLGGTTAAGVASEGGAAFTIRLPRILAAGANQD